MPRVLHVIQNLNYGGMEKLLADMARSFDPGRVETHIMALQYLGRFADGLEDHATLHQAGKQSQVSLVRPRRLSGEIAAIAPDVVHTHSGVWYKASLAARMAGVPRLVHTDHGRTPPDPWLARTLDRLASRRTDAVVAVSEALAAHLAEAGIVADPSRVHVIRNGVDSGRFRPGAAEPDLRDELGLADGQLLIGSIGRLEPVKAFDRLVRAVAALRRRWSGPNPPVLALAGDGSERARLEALAAELGADDGIHLLGWRDDVHVLHASLDLFVMSSISEGTSVSLLEAMSAGLCPVVTRVGGNPAVLGDELAHRLVDPDRPDALVDALEEALLDPEARTADAARARCRVQERFSLAAMVDAYEALYSNRLAS